MANFVELSGGTIIPSSALTGGGLDQNAALDGGAIQISGGGGGGSNLQTKSVSYTPSETAISATVNPDAGYDGMSSVSVSVGAISSTYVGTGIARRTSSDLSASGATVTAPSGYYENSASKAVTDANLIASNIKKDVTIFGVTGTFEGDGMSNDVKDALLTLASKVAYIDDEGQDAYEALLEALYPIDYLTATYTQSGTVYDTASLDSLKNDLVVTATFEDGSIITVTGYTLSGSLVAGTSTITVSYSGATTTFNVTVTRGFLWQTGDGLISTQPYVTASANSTTSMTETIDANGNSKFSASSQSSGTSTWGVNFGNHDIVSGGELTVEFYTTALVPLGNTNSTTPGTIFWQLFDGSANGAIGGLSRISNQTNVPTMRKTVGNTASWLTGTNPAYSTWHTLNVKYENNTQTVTLDGTELYSGVNPATTTNYMTHTGFRFMQGTSAMNVTIRKLEVSVY